MRGRQKSRVHTASHGRVFAVLTVAAKLPPLNDTGLQCLRHLQFLVFKHLLEGRLESHNAVVIVTAKHRVVNLHRTVGEIQWQGAQAGGAPVGG